MGHPAVPFMSVTDYLEFEKNSTDKHEYYEGAIVNMAGASLQHNRIVANISRSIGNMLSSKGCDVFSSDLRVCTPFSDNYMYADVTIVCEEPILNTNTGLDTLTNPGVIFEVLSPTAEGRYNGKKLFKYIQIPSLQAYIRVNAAHCEVDVIQRQSDDTWKITQLTKMDDMLHLVSIGVSLPLKDVYNRVQLTDNTNT